MVIKCCSGEDRLNLNVHKHNVSVGPQRHLQQDDDDPVHDKDGVKDVTWKVKDPPAGCSASCITETLFHSTVILSGSDNTDMVEWLDLLGSS